MFVAIYEFIVKDGMQEEFVASWLEVTRGIYKHYGSHGSRLQKDKSGAYVGYAQWPDRETWARDWSADTRLEPARTTMRSCLDGVMTVYEAEVVSDYLQPGPHSCDPKITEDE